MKKVIKKQSNKESVNSRQLWGAFKKSTPGNVGEKEFSGVDLNVGQDILAIIDALPFLKLQSVSYHLVPTGQGFY